MAYEILIMHNFVTISIYYESRLAPRGVALCAMWGRYPMLAIKFAHSKRYSTQIDPLTLLKAQLVHYRPWRL